MRKILIATMVFLSLCASSAIVTADPTIDSVTTNPINPTPQSDITVTVTITGDDVTAVILTVSECRRDTGTCFIYTDYTMQQNQDGDWVTDAKLQDTSGVSDYISYIFNVTDSGVEYKFSGQWEVDIDTSGNGGNGDNGGTDGNGSPGFEIITLLAAIVIGILLIKRKRS